MINDKKNEKLGLFGGTFDPIHLGHTLIAEWILNYLGLTKVLFIPNKIHPFSKRGNITTADKRADMIRLAIKDYPLFEMSAIEIERSGISYAVDTIRAMIAAYPQAEIFYIMGEDNLEKFALWKEADEILNLSQVVTFRRRITEGKEIKADFLEKMRRLETPYFDISSTDVRARIEKGLKFQSLLHPAVYNYIVDNKIYAR